MSMLPIIDVAVRDAGEAYQEFGLELGPVCFGVQKWNPQYTHI